MNQDHSTWALPDPVTQVAFYRDVPAKRLIAFVIDTVIITLIALLLVPLTAFSAVFYFAFLLWVVAFVYRVVTLARRSATPGMRLVGIEFRTIHGEHLDRGLALAHTLVFMMSMSLVFPQILSVILMLTGARGQGLGDLLLGTAAINRAARA